MHLDAKLAGSNHCDMKVLTPKSRIFREWDLDHLFIIVRNVLNHDFQRENPIQRR